jgi:hypothetical protein
MASQLAVLGQSDVDQIAYQVWPRSPAPRTALAARLVRGRDW